jgi:hypothetical protein
LIECSGAGISRQLPDGGQGYAIAGSDRMQRAIRIDPSAAAPDKNFPANDFRRYRARVGTSSARKRPLPVKTLAILLQQRRRWFCGRHLRFIGLGKEG